MTRQAISAVSRSRGNEKVLFLLDEFANMGRLAGLAEALTALPGLGVRVWAFVQELADIERIYGRHTAQTIASQAEVKQFFAVQNHDLACKLSAALGKETVKTTSFGLGRRPDDEVSESVGEAGKPLLAPDEIRKMEENEQLLLITRLPPIRAQRIPVWLIAPWQNWLDDNPVEEGRYPQAAPEVTVPQG